jgi:AGCS family alanine or glycine:cation symporter
MKDFMRKGLLIVMMVLLATITNAKTEKEVESTDNSANKELTLSQKIDRAFTPLVHFLTDVLFVDPFEMIGVYDPQIYDKSGNPVYDENGNPVQAPLRLIVLWLLAGGLFFSFYLKFIGVRGLKHAYDILKGKFSKKGTKGEVSSYQSVTTALSATVGMGNIAGVALAIGIGGPGATFWMIVAGLLGMSLKFAECTLGIKYRKFDKDGTVSGGPMYYLKRGLEKKGGFMKGLGVFLAFLFALTVMGGSVGGGNMLQANQAFHQLAIFFPELNHYGAYYGIILAIFVGAVIIGGIKSIGKVTEKIVPFMAGIYILAALVIIAMNIHNTGHAFYLIFHHAFNPDAVKGGIIGVMIYGIQRGAFSNEAGMGSAAIAHSASQNNEPVSEGIVASIEPFIDTILICTMTALVLIFTGFAENTQGLEGVQLTSAAFKSVISWFPYVLLVAVTLFAFSTIISWSYYGLKGFDYLFGGLGERWFGTRKVTNVTFQMLFLVFTVIGASTDILTVMDFSDMMILAMAIPNLLGLFIMSKEIKYDLNVYWGKLKDGTLLKEAQSEE